MEKVRECGLKLSRDEGRRAKRRPPRKAMYGAFKMPVLRASGAAGHGIPPGSSGQAHVGVGVREHVKRLEWKTRYDESAKLFDENLQNS